MIVKNRVRLIARMTRDTEASEVSVERECERHGAKDDDSNDPVKVTEEGDSNTIATRPVAPAKGLSNYAPETIADPFILYPRV